MSGITDTEANELARHLAEITGESPIVAVVTALRERLQRERERRAVESDFATRVELVAAELRANYDTRPVTQAEWRLVVGDTA